MAATAFCIVIAVCVGAPPAQAQFVCDSTTPGGADGATAAGIDAVACGTNATASGSASSAFGFGSTASGNSSSAYGFNSSASGFGSSAYGVNSTASDIGSSAYGIDSTASALNSSAFGNSSTASGNLSSAFGFGSTASGLNSTASGDGSTASGNFSAAYGHTSTASGAQSSAFGDGSTASGTFSAAFGSFAKAGFYNSAAFGSGATATRDNQQVFGTTDSTYTAPGITSAASKAAQSGTLQVVTSDAGGNLAVSPLASLGIASTTDISAINARLDELANRSSKAYTGIAMAFAMAGVPTLLPNEKFAVTANWGTFEGANGLALDAAVRITDNVQLNGGIGYGPNEHIAGGRVGLRFGW